MVIFLTIAVIVLMIAVVCIVIYLWWLPIKVKALIRENEEINDAIDIDNEADFSKEVIEDEC